MASVKVNAEANDTKHEYQDAHRKIESRHWSASRSWPEKNLPRLGKINDVHQTERHAQTPPRSQGNFLRG
jgi:hypothetical protein